MRRYDTQYREMKDVMGRGDIGAPLMMHVAHRNPSVPGHYTSDPGASGRVRKHVLNGRAGN
jgi:myo-inositol 2-dehydrogenase/D-chiro-inositol 1-dehydrogenase